MKFALDKDGVPVLQLDGEEYDRDNILERMNECRSQQAAAGQGLRSWESRLKQLDEWAAANSAEASS